MLDDGHGIVQQRGIERLQPVDARIAAKPSHLLARQTLRLLRDAHERVVQIAQAVQIVDDLLIAERLACGDAKLRTNAFDFLDETVLQHLLGADVDSAVQFLTRQIKADLHGGNHIPVMRQARRIRTPRHLDDLQRADGTSRIVRIHAGGRFRILRFELVEQGAGAFDLLAFLKALAHLGVGAGEGNVVDGGAGVQTGASHEDRTHALGLQFGDFGACNLLETRHGHGVIRFDDVDEMMSHLGLFLRGRLGGADIHSPVHLVGIGVDDFRLLALGRQRFGDGDTESRLA